MNALETPSPLANALRAFSAQKPEWSERLPLEAQLELAIRDADETGRTLAVHALIAQASEEALEATSRELLGVFRCAGISRAKLVDSIVALPEQQRRVIVASMLFFLETRVVEQLHGVLKELGAAAE